MADFSKLRAGLKNDSAKRPTSDLKGEPQGNIPAENKNAVAGQIDALAGDPAKMAGKPGGNMADLSPLQAGRLLQDKIKRGECAIWAIFKAMKRNAPPEEIALIAVKGLSLVTSDPMVFTTVAEAYRQQYGMSIAEKPPYEITYCQNGK